MADSLHSQIPSLRLSRDTTEFPQGPQPFRLAPGPDLEMLGQVVWAEPPLLRGLADGQFPVAEVQRVLRIAPWMAIGTGTPSIPSLMEQVAAGNVRPVVTVTPGDDRSIAFAFRIVQAALTWSEEWRCADVLDNAARQALRDVHNMAVPLPRTSEELLPAFTAAPCDHSVNAAPGPEPRGCPGEWLYWHLVGSYGQPPYEQPADEESGRPGKSIRLVDVATDATARLRLLCGCTDRARREILDADRVLHSVIQEMSRSVRAAPAGGIAAADASTFDQFTRVLLILLCDFDTQPGSDDLSGVVAPLPHWPPPSAAIGQRQSDLLAAVLPDERGLARVMRAATGLLESAPASLGGESLSGFVYHVVKELAGCFDATGSVTTDDALRGGTTAGCPPVLFLDPRTGGDSGSHAPVGNHAARDPLAYWEGACLRNLARIEAGAKAGAYMYEPGFSTLPLRYRFGLLLDPGDRQLAGPPEQTGPAALRGRTGDNVDTAFLPLLSRPDGQAHAAFALRLGRGFLMVLPTGISDPEVLCLVARAQQQFGVSKSGLGSYVGAPPLSPDTSPTRTVDPKPPCCALADLALRVVACKGLVITGPTCDGGVRGEATIPWGDPRLWCKRGRSTASLDKGTNQLSLLMALASAKGDKAKLTATALAESIGMGASKSEPRFRATIDRLRAILADVIEPYISAAGLKELAAKGSQGRGVGRGNRRHQGRTVTPDGSATGSPESAPDSAAAELLRRWLISQLDRGKHDQPYELRLAIVIDAGTP